MTDDKWSYGLPERDPLPHWCVAHPARKAVVWHGHIHLPGREHPAGWCQECVDFEHWTILEQERLELRGLGCIDCYGYWSASGKQYAGDINA